LAFRLPNCRLKPIGGHLRRDLDPDKEVEVEVLNVTAEQARIRLLSIDSLASLVTAKEQLRDLLRELAPAAAPELQAARGAAAAASLAPPTSRPPREFTSIPEQFLILVTCRDEKHYIELLVSTELWPRWDVRRIGSELRITRPRFVPGIASVSKYRKIAGCASIFSLHWPDAARPQVVQW
jgi:hypothetical protein